MKKRLLGELESEYKTKHQAAKHDKDRDALKERMSLAKAEIDSVVVGKVFDEIQYHRFSVKYGTLFEAKIGAEAIFDLFKAINLEDLKATLEARYEQAGIAEKEKLAKRIALITSLIAAKVRP